MVEIVSKRSARVGVSTSTRAGRREKARREKRAAGGAQTGVPLRVTPEVKREVAIGHLEALAQVPQMLLDLDKETRRRVAVARRRKASWRAIGEALGISESTAHSRYSGVAQRPKKRGKSFGGAEGALGK